MRQFSRLLLAGVCAVSLWAYADERPISESAAIKVVLPGGTYHATEIPYDAGPGWLALVEGAVSSLVPIEMKIHTEYDPVLDSENGPHSGKHVTTKPEVSATLLIQGSTFREGPLLTAAVEGELRGLSPKKITLNNQSFSLQLNDDCGKASNQCEWVLTDGQTRQTVSQLSAWFIDGELTTEASNTGLLWAGDLDRDGNLDLIVDVSDHYNAVAQVRVLLSSSAGNGQLVEEVGSFSAVGC